MDSPLLPTLSRPNYSLDDPSLLADLSLDSEPPLSPTPGPYDDSHLFTNDHDDHTISSSSSSHGYANQQTGGGGGGQGRVRIERQLDDQEEDDTPQKPRSKPKSTGGGGGGGAAHKPRFSLFAAPRPPSAEENDHDDVHEGEEEDQTIHGSTSASTSQHSTTTRTDDRVDGSQQRESQSRPKQSSEERDGKLRESLYELRKMNEVFESFLGALEGVRGHNQRLAERVQQTSALLDEYTAIMGQAEHTQRLIMNPKWTGSVDDATALLAEEQARQAAEQAALIEAERKAEAARLAEEEKERRERERASEAPSSGRGRGRGRGGIGASTMGGTRGGVTRGRGTGIPRPSMAAPRPTSAGATRRGTTTGTTSGGGLGGQYSHVKSSGYGPR
ncbi:hypothetical protein CI109_106493 [Kwoniella shandongensis]|uniref:DASH complex subunit DUO1 n=1 Tax=Kwoniella shandongensis TaxID=1734106 RepID=A0A5M6C1B1_9TREE|nr:uncharacterized protein CI109_002675 [Kwoniella shandongensis]KAA5528918.1 hypothetical protein CI109_002675 [Kwoniella shandongensis]